MCARIYVKWDRHKNPHYVHFGGAGKWENEERYIPLVVSLSLTKKIPRWFPGFKSNLSASFLPILPKYHLENVKGNMCISTNISKNFLCSGN